MDKGSFTPIQTKLAYNKKTMDKSGTNNEGKKIMVTIQKNRFKYYKLRAEDSQLYKLDGSNKLENGQGIYMYKLNNGNLGPINSATIILNSEHKVIVPHIDGEYQLIWKKGFLEWLDWFVLRVLLLLLPVMFLGLILKLDIPELIRDVYYVIAFIELACLGSIVFLTPIRVLGGLILYLSGKETKTPYFKITGESQILSLKDVENEIHQLFVKEIYSNNMNEYENEQLKITYEIVSNKRKIKGIDLIITLNPELTNNKQVIIRKPVSSRKISLLKLSSNDLIDLKNDILKFSDNDFEYYTSIGSIIERYEKKEVKLDSKFYTYWRLGKRERDRKTSIE